MPNALNDVQSEIICYMKDIKQKLKDNNNDKINFTFYFDKSKKIYKKLNIYRPNIDYEEMSFFIYLNSDNFPFCEESLLKLIDKDEKKLKKIIFRELSQIIEANIPKIFLNEFRIL